MGILLVGAELGPNRKRKRADEPQGRREARKGGAEEARREGEGGGEGGGGGGAEEEGREGEAASVVTFKGSGAGAKRLGNPR